MKQLLNKIGLLEYMGNIKTYYFRLSGREQKIFSTSCFAGGLVVLILIYSILFAANKVVSNDIAQSRKTIRDILDQGQQYQTLDQTIKTLDQSIIQTPGDFQLATELESMAQTNSIKIESIKDRPGSPHDFYSESQAVVNIGEVQIRPLLDFLLMIESSEKLMRISSIQIKPNFKDAKLLSVTFIVSTFQHKT